MLQDVGNSRMAESRQQDRNNHITQLGIKAPYISFFITELYMEKTIELREFACFNYNPYLNCFPAFCCSELKFIAHFHFDLNLETDFRSEKLIIYK